GVAAGPGVGGAAAERRGAAAGGRAAGRPGGAGGRRSDGDARLLRLPAPCGAAPSGVRARPGDRRAAGGTGRARHRSTGRAVLRRNDGVLPLADGRRVALVGPVADDPMAMLGCYAFPNHVAPHHPGYELGLEIASLREELARLVPDLTYAQGCDVRGEDTSGIAAAVEAAAGSDVCVLAVGDRAGLFGRGTSGEGCDAADLTLPGVQAELVRAVLATG